ncbi:MAG: ABC transporter permease [Abitibacteriaceae bacterium]|nr:ABC transporter permease [Abditibacteriaceae bacterium]
MREKSNTSRTFLLPLAVGVAAVTLWWLLCTSGTWSPTQFPAPREVWAGFGEEFQQGRLLHDIGASLFRVGTGFGLAVLLGVPLGLWLGSSALARLALLPWINFFRCLSPLAWIGFAILWFGIGHKSAIFLIFMATFFPLVLSVVAAVASIPTVYFRVAHDHGFGSAEMLWRVTLPAIMPQLITALRVVAGVAWVVVVAAEMTGAQEGLGYAVWDARNGLRPDLLAVEMIVIGSIGVALDWLLVQLTKIRSVRWGYER